jgi:hypothetical protein
MGGFKFSESPQLIVSSLVLQTQLIRTKSAIGIKRAISILYSLSSRMREKKVGERFFLYRSKFLAEDLNRQGLIFPVPTFLP